MLQVHLHPQTDIQAELLESQVNRGGVFFPFDAANTVPFTVSDTAYTGRLGIRHEFDASSELLFSAMYQTLNTVGTNLLFNAEGTFNWEASTGEAQYTYRGDLANVVAGLGHLQGRRVLVGTNIAPDLSYDNAYVYAQLRDPGACAAVERTELVGSTVRLEPRDVNGPMGPVRVNLATLLR